jgi:hypothetical protein
MLYINHKVSVNVKVPVFIFTLILISFHLFVYNILNCEYAPKKLIIFSKQILLYCFAKLLEVDGHGISFYGPGNHNATWIRPLPAAQGNFKVLGGLASGSHVNLQRKSLNWLLCCGSWGQNEFFPVFT